MLATLATIAEAEGLVFRFGSLSEENIDADDELVDRWLYQEGYLAGSVNLATDNSLVVSYTVNLWLLATSRLADVPVERGPQFVDLLAQLQRIYRKLGNVGDLSPGEFIEGVNLFDRNVDGIRLRFTFTPFVPLTVC